MSFGQEDLIKNDILGFLDQHEKKELLRFVAVGSVDDGKSTLIGRLLHDAKGVYEDQLADASSTTGEGEVAIDFARITDGLQAEREQGITIDVAYRYFSTPRRKFIIADTPGHVQYTRNMATGASTADVAVILIDARLGVLQQSRRHAYLANLLGIRHLLVCVNKMDLKDFRQDVFEEIQKDFSSFAEQLDFTTVTYVPISALLGVNIVAPSERTPWYDGPTVIGFLETVHIAGDRNLDDFRLPVQYVLRPNLDYRGFSGQIVSGVVSKGDEVMALPSRKTSRVKAIDTYHGELEQAQAPLSVTLRLEDEIDISRGDVIVPVNNLPTVARRVEAHVVWLNETPLDPRRSYLIKHTARYVRVDVDKIDYRVNLETLEREDATDLQLNDVARLTLTTHRPLIFDPYTQNRGTGAFIVIDTSTNNTVGAGMLIGEAEAVDVKEERRTSQVTDVAPRERAAVLAQRPAAIWLTGGDEAQRADAARAIERTLVDKRHLAVILDPTDVLTAAGAELTRSLDRVAALARRITDAGVIAIITHSLRSQEERESARGEVSSERFLEIELQGGEPVHGFEPSSAPFLRLDLAAQQGEQIGREVLSQLLQKNMLDHSDR